MDDASSTVFPMTGYGGARTRAAVVVGIVVAVGTVLASVTQGGSRPADLGLAILSGGIVGGSLILVESLLTQAADKRNDRTALRMQLTSTVGLNGIDLSGEELNDYYLPGKDLVAAKLSGTALRAAILIYGDLRHANLSGADLRGADLSGCTLRYADLTGALLEGAILNDSDLRETRFDRADLTNATITRVNASEASFKDAVLNRALLREVGIGGAVLAGARGLDTATLEGIYYDDRTVWPANLDLPPRGPKTDRDLTGLGIAEYLAWRRAKDVPQE